MPTHTPHRLKRAREQADAADLRSRTLTALIELLRSMLGPRFQYTQQMQQQQQQQETPFSTSVIRSILEPRVRDWPADMRRYLFDHLGEFLAQQEQQQQQQQQQTQQQQQVQQQQTQQQIGLGYLYNSVLREQDHAHSHAKRAKRMVTVLEEIIQPAGLSVPGAGVEEAAAPAGPVIFTLYGPVTITAANPFVLDLWTFTEAQRAKVEAFVKRLGESATGDSAGANVQLGTAISVHVESSYLDIQDPSRVFVWKSEEKVESFDCALKASFSGKEFPAAGSVTISIEGMELARITFWLNAVKAPGAPPATAQLGQRLQEPKSAFASYSSENRIEVEARVQGMRAVRPDFDIFLDVDKLRQGDDWEEKLYTAISTSDILFLFWSKPAADSTWVQREWRYGYQKKGLPFISPVPLESPELVKPPPELSSLNFNDKYLMFIYAQKYINQQKAAGAKNR